MIRSFSLFLALRYLVPRRAFLAIISVISVAGVTLGIAVLIVVTSVMTGFDRDLKKTIVGFDAHLFLYQENDVMENWRELLPIVRGTPGVTAAAPFMFGPVVAEFQNKRAVPKVRGVDPAEEVKVSDIGQPEMYRDKPGRETGLAGGSFDLEDGDKCVLGVELARSLGVTVGSEITLYSPGNFAELKARLDELDHVADGAEKNGKMDELRQAILPRTVTVTGIYSSGRFFYDSEFILVPLYLGQELYGLRGAVHGISARTADAYHAEATREALLARLPVDGPPLRVETWSEKNGAILSAIQVERSTMFIILMFLIVVAAFCVMVTLITVTMLKTRDIGIMKALGANTWQVARVFLAQGVVVALLGVVTGVGLGLGIIAARNPLKDWLASALHIELFPRQVYGLDRLPAYNDPQIIGLICVCAFLICSLAALLPAWVAARMDPVRALRFE